MCLCSSNLLHSSGPNLSQDRRWNLVLAYNQVSPSLLQASPHLPGEEQTSPVQLPAPTPASPPGGGSPGSGPGQVGTPKVIRYLSSLKIQFICTVHTASTVVLSTVYCLLPTVYRLLSPDYCLLYVYGLLSTV